MNGSMCLIGFQVSRPSSSAVGHPGAVPRTRARTRARPSRRAGRARRGGTAGTCCNGGVGSRASRRLADGDARKLAGAEESQSAVGDVTSGVRHALTIAPRTPSFRARAIARLDWNFSENLSCRISHPRRRTCGSPAPPPCAIARSAPRCAPRSRRPRRRPNSEAEADAADQPARPCGAQGTGPQEFAARHKSQLAKAVADRLTSRSTK